MVKLFFVFLLVIQLPFTAPAQNNLNQNIKDFIEPYLTNRDFDGYILVECDSNVVFSEPFSLLDKELDENSKFKVGSITKTFTAEAISKLVKQGLISTNTSVRQLTGFKKSNKISLENLLTHSSGIKDYYAIKEFLLLRDKKMQLKAFGKWISQFPLDFEPGESNRYSNSGYNLLALVIESVSGFSYDRFLKDSIFSMLDMEDTGSLVIKIPKNLVEGYSPGRLPSLLRSPNKLHYSWLIGSGSVYSTAKDLLKWCSFIEKRININNDWFPYGWGQRSRDSIKYIEQNGRIPGFASAIRIYPSKGLNIIVLSRIESDAVNDIAEGIANLYFNAEVIRPDVRSVKILSKEQRAIYIGTYQFSPDFFVTVTELAGGLGIATGKGANLDFAILDPLGNDEFFFRVTHNSISFEKDNNDNITSLYWAGNGPFPKIKE